MMTTADFTAARIAAPAGRISVRRMHPSNDAILDPQDRWGASFAYDRERDEVLVFLGSAPTAEDVAHANEQLGVDVLSLPFTVNEPNPQLWMRVRDDYRWERAGRPSSALEAAE